MMLGRPVKRAELGAIIRRWHLRPPRRRLLWVYSLPLSPLRIHHRTGRPAVASVSTSLGPTRQERQLQRQRTQWRFARRSSGDSCSPASAAARRPSLLSRGAAGRRAPQPRRTRSSPGRAPTRSSGLGRPVPTPRSRPPSTASRRRPTQTSPPRLVPDGSFRSSPPTRYFNEI
jgi:hypothetical protein